MANNQMTFSLGIKTTADMSGLNQLKKALQELSTYTADTTWAMRFSPTEITNMTKSVITLGNALDNAFDVNLNGINFNKFQQSLKASGMTMSQIGQNMSKFGVDGQKAFADTTAQIYKMNTAVQYSNKFVNKLWESFGNTIKYTAFNAAINNITGSVQKAVGYIKDLDRSLNDIRIVSGQSAEQMDEFAKKANEAAKALGSSTTDYTDAALIYYQQGLTGADVTERTDVTQKMANVTGSTAQQVSEDLTAIWNNFYDGSKSLEYYADVLTALGASTASSTEEIAQGLEKFAAVAGTVGLSYEYATSALATVVAETRQSADTVGTAFKTLFARIQGLSLGETLDDGTTLTKYSKALLQVGINIKDSNGELKTMDTILDEMGAKWQTLNKDQQVALAQTVAGTRQYTQLVALMDKWDVFKDNLNTTANATGELSKQQDIYMERTQAHLEKLGAAAEDLYASLFDTKDLNKWIDRFTGLIEQVDNLVEALGGLNGILPMLAAGGLSAFSGQIATSVSQSMINKRNQEMALTDDQAKVGYLQQTGLSNIDKSVSGLGGQELERQSNFYKEMYANAKLLTSEEREQYNTLVEAGAELVKANISLENAKNFYTATNNILGITKADFEDIVGLQEKLAVQEGNLNALRNEGVNSLIDLATTEEKVNGLAKQLAEDYSLSEVQLRRILNTCKIVDEDTQEVTFNTQLFEEEIERVAISYNDVKKAVNQVANGQAVINAQSNMLADANQRTQVKSYLDLAGALGQVASSIMIIKNLGSIWSNDNLTGGEKILQTVMNLSMALPMLYNSFEKVKNSKVLLDAYHSTNSYKNKSIKLFQELEEKKKALEEAELKHKKAIEQQKVLEEKMASQKRIAIAKVESEEKQRLLFNEVKDKRRQQTQARINLANIYVKEGGFEGAEAANMAASISNEQLQAEIISQEKLLATANAENTKKINASIAAKRELIRANQELSISQEEYNATVMANTAADYDNALAKATQEVENQKQIISTNELIVANTAEDVSKKKESVTETENAIAKLSSTLATENLSAAESAEAIATFIAAGATKALTIALNLLKGALSLLMGPLLGVTLGITALGVAYAYFSNQLKNNISEAEEISNKTRILNEQNKEHYNSIKELSKAYEEFNDKLDELSLTEIRNKTYQLCMQYGEESLAIQSLTADYDTLKKSIEEVEAQRAKEYEESSKQTVDSQKDTIIRKLEKEAGGKLGRIDEKNGRKTIDLKGMALVNKTEEKEMSALKEFSSSYGITDLFINSDHIDVDKLSQLLVSNQEGLKQILTQYDTEMSKQLLGYFDNISEDLEKLAEDTSNLKEATLASITATLSESDVDSNNFINTRNSLIEQIQATGQYNNNEIEKIVNDLLMSESAEGLRNTQIYSLAESLEGDTERYFEDLVKLDTEERQIVASFSNYIKLTNKDIKEFIEDSSIYLKQFKEQNDFSSVSVSLEAATKNGKFSKEDIERLFPEEESTITILADIKINKEEFEKLDFSSQSMYASQALITALQNNDSEAYFADQIKIYDDMITEIKDKEISFGNYSFWTQDKKEQYEEYLKYWTDKIPEAFGDLTPFFENITEEQMNIIDNLVAQGGTVQDFYDALDTIGLSDIADNLYQDFYNIGIASSDSIEDVDGLKEQLIALKNAMAYSGGLKALDSQTAAINELINAQENLKNKEIDVDQVNQDIENNYKNLDSTIDHLQSQYSSLQSVVDDYNDNHKLSLDSIQTLVKMDNAFVSSLQFENDQLSINGERYTSLMDIQMAYMRQQIMNDMIADIHVITMDSVADATDGAKDATNTFSGSISEAVAQMKAGQGVFTQWAITAASISGADMSKYGDRINQAITAAYNKLKLVESVSYTEGSGGKGSSSKSKKDEKDFKDEFDRYWDINNAIEKVTHAISQLDKQEEKLSRHELISALATENKLLEVQADKYKDLAAEQKKEASELQEVLSGYGIIFDSQGQIQNYLAQTEQSLNDYNAAVQAYNAGTLSEESFNLYEKEYENFKETLDKYDELYYDKMVETQDKLDEIARQIKENNLTGWETELEIILETKEAERDWNDFLGKIEDNFKSVYTDFVTQFRTAIFDATSLGGEGGSIETDIRAIKDVIREIDTMNAGGESDMFESISQAQEKLKELQSTMKDDAEALFDLYQEGWDRYIDAIGEVEDKFSKLRDEFERINDDLDHQSKMIELLYGENAYDYLDELYKAQSNNYLSQMASLRDQGAFFKQQYEEAAATYGEESDAAQAFKDAWLEVVDELHSTEENYLSNLADEYANTITNAFYKAEKELMNGSTYKFVSTQWDLAKEAAKDVYDEQERIYQLEKLGNKYQEAINNASTAKAQQKLQDLYESQVNSLEDKTRLTKYDVELAEKRLAVAQAEAALEDAQNAKNTLKVTRNEAGNWAYQYVADDDDVDDKQQALLDAQYEAYEYVKQNVSDLKESMIQLAKDWSTTIAELEQKMIGATEEEKVQYQAMIDWYNEYYAEQMNIKAEELALHEQQLGQETNALLRTEYNVNEEAYELMTEAQKACIDSMSEHAIESAVDVYNAVSEVYDEMNEYADAAMRETIDYFSTAASDITDVWANNPDSVKNAMLEALETCKQAQIEYAEEVRIGCIAAGEDYTDVENQINEDIDATNALSDATTEMVEEAIDELDYYEEALAYLEDAWNRVKDKIIDNQREIEAYMAMLGLAIDKAVDFTKIIREATAAQRELNDAMNGGSGGSTSPTSDDSKTFWKEGASNPYYVYYENGERKTTTDYQGMIKQGYSYEGLHEGTGLVNEKTVPKYKITDRQTQKTASMPTLGGSKLAYDMTKEEVEDFILKYYGGNFDRFEIEELSTGGYTGEWGNDGRMAILHQKELVLNANDTENMLATVSAVRDLSSVSSSIQQAVADSISNALMKISGLASSAIGNTISNNSSNNNYIINAEFPAANDVNDIREALLSLPNLAAQRVNQKTI